jgi:hypothetical protein
MAASHAMPHAAIVPCVRHTISRCVTDRSIILTRSVGDETSSGCHRRLLQGKKGLRS